MAGGDKDAMEWITPILKNYSASIKHLGGAGNG